jgi:hypothetical protein
LEQLAGADEIARDHFIMALMQLAEKNEVMN